MSDRTYDDGCGLARTLDVVGERWTLLVVRELLLGPKRFSDLKAGLANPSQNVLSQRLREMEESGLVQKVSLGPPARADAYELTARGIRLEPALLELARWGAAFAPKNDAGQSSDAFALALRALYRPGSFTGDIGLRIAGDLLAASAGSELTMHRATTPGPTVIDGAVRAFQRAIWGGQGLAPVVRDGALTVTGDEDVAAAFLRSFPAP